MPTVSCSNGAEIPVWMTKMELGIESPVSERSNWRGVKVLVSPGDVVALGASQRGFSGKTTFMLRLGNEREVGRYKLSLQTSWV